MEEKRYTLDDFVEVMKALRGENGCPWDRVQTHESLRMDMLEEAYEAANAIDNNDMPNLFVWEIGGLGLSLRNWRSWSKSARHCEFGSVRRKL